MKKFTLRHEINCSEERFWEVFFDKEFNTSLFLEELGFPAFEILEQTESDTEIRRRVRGQPKMNMPKPVAKLLGDSFAYEEDGVWNKASKKWTWTMTPSTLAGKLKNGGSVRIESIGDDRVRRVAELEVEAKVFGIGGLLESSTQKEMTEGWNKSADFMNQWLKDH